MKKDMRIVFMGTPEFAVTILDSMIKDNRNIVGVITAPDKPAGRGRKLNQSEVKKYAVSNNLNILQPTNLKAPEFVEQLQKLNADLFVVVAFRMLPEIVWSMPPYGTINLHASLLPNYRGAAPINWAIINGETETGVTTFFIEKEIDTGEIIERNSIEIGKNETVGELYAKLMTLGASTVLSTLDKIESGNYKAIPQEQLIKKDLKLAPKIFKADCEIDFSKASENIHNFCRGLDPYPGAWTTLTETKTGKEIHVKLFGSRQTNLPSTSKDIQVKDHLLLFPSSDFYVAFSEIQLEGKRKMNTKTFLAGHNISNYHLTKSF